MDLDDGQRAAVLHISGQLLVRAGPGSGKTHLISEKVNRLVAGGIPQESILCMTFTEKAAGEMRQRLAGPGTDNVRVGTIHSLCLEILKENRIKTGVGEGAVVFGGLPRLAWCRRNMDTFGIDSGVIRLDKNPLEVLSSMLAAIRLAKRELISADDLDRHVRAGLATTPDDENLARLGELVKLYRAYDRYKNDRNLIDYDDMMAMTVNLLERDARVREEYHNRYRHILIDEFQDNNYAQFQVARLLAGSGNITAVGDDDQSVMGFQGAFDGIFDEFRNAYPGHKQVELERNYRCSGNISALSAGLLRSGEDYGRDAKRLAPGRRDGERVVVAAAADEGSEREFVADAISKLKIPYGGVAVLCRTNHSCQEFARALRMRGIPVALVGAANLLRNPMTSEIMALLRIAASPETSGASISLMLGRRGIREYNILAVNRAAKRLVSDTGGARGDGVFLTLERHTGSDQDAEIREIARRLRRMSDEAKRDDLLGVLHRIMTDYTDAYRKNANAPDGDEDAAGNLAALNWLYEMARDYQRHYYGRWLSDFVEYVELADEPGAADAVAEYGAAAGNAVNVLTMHKSKGKEFDAVFVTGLYDDEMPGKPRRADFEIPRELFRGSGRRPYDRDLHVRERRSLLYVAMTRARDLLYLSYPRFAKDGIKERKPSRFLQGMESDPRVQSIEHGPARKSLPSAIRDAAWAEKKLIVQEEVCKAVRESRPVAAVRGMADLVKILQAERQGGGGNGGDSIEQFDVASVLKAGLDGATATATCHGPPAPGPKSQLVSKEALVLSATGIESYRRCPLMFKYGRILRIPERPSMPLRKGAVVHAALERLGSERMSGGTPDVDGAVRLAAERLRSNRDEYDQGEYDSAESSLGDIIRNYVDWDKASPNTPVGIEVEFGTVIDGIRYKGKIDRLEKNPDGEYEVVDFKTGNKLIKRSDLRTSPQANIYAHAVRERYGSLPVKFSMVYPAAGNKAREYAVTEESLKQGLGIVKDCASRITDGQFDPAPSYACRWCSYNTICPAAKMN